MEKFSLETLVRKNVAQMKPYSSARDEYKAQQKMVFLDANENPFENGVNRYPDPQQSNLKNQIGTLRRLPTENILLGNGSDEVLDLIFRAFCRPGKDNVITLPPTYGMYKVLADLNEIEDREVVLKPDFQPDIEKILEQVDRNTKLLFLCSPNNPTGNSFSEESIQTLLEKIKGLVIIDEAYIDFSAKESWLQKLKEFPNLVITQTLSKAYGLAGIRLGICYASAEIISILNKIKPPYNVNELTQERAGERLRRREQVASEVREILEQKEVLANGLGNLNMVDNVFPSDANFLLVRVDNAEVRYNQLLDRGIVVRNRSNQVLCENTLRFTVGTAEENEELLKMLKEIDS